MNIGTHFSVEQLGYFQPGHVETLCHSEGRNHPLARTALYHEIAHENLTSWSTIGLFAQALSRIAARLPKGHTDPPDPLLCLATVVDSSRLTHEGFATFAQLMYIGYCRFGYEELDDSFRRLPREYQSAAGKFLVIRHELTRDAGSFDSSATALAVRTFAIAALNVDIFRRVGSFHHQMKADLASYFADPFNNPDARLEALLTSLVYRKAEPLRLTIQKMLSTFTEERALVRDGDRASLEIKLAQFSHRINRAVLKYFAKRSCVDPTALDYEARKACVTRFLASAVQHYGLDPQSFLNIQWPSSVDPLQKQHEKRHRVEFADAPQNFGDVPVVSIPALSDFLSDAQARGACTAIALLSGNKAETTWGLDAATRDDTSRYRTGVATRRAGLSQLPEVLAFARALNTPLVVLDGLLEIVSAPAGEVVLRDSHRLYIFCPVVSIAQVERFAQRWITPPSSVLMLTNAIDHHALLIVREQDAQRSLIAILAEDVVPRYEYFLSRAFHYESRIADPVADAELLLAAWVYSYGPCSQFLREKC
jgi:hypothetical protein